MAELNKNLNLIDSDTLKSDRNNTSINKERKEYRLVRPYNYDCQFDQYNVKLCGIVFDAIGEPDFVFKNDNLDNEIDTQE